MRKKVRMPQNPRFPARRVPIRRAALRARKRRLVNQAELKPVFEYLSAVLRGGVLAPAVNQLLCLRGLSLRGKQGKRAMFVFGGVLNSTANE
jgi:hypothetical protein